MGVMRFLVAISFISLGGMCETAFAGDFSCSYGKSGACLVCDPRTTSFHPLTA